MPPRSFTCGVCGKSRIESRFSATSIRKYEQALHAASRRQTGRPRGFGPRDNGRPNPHANSNENVVGPRCIDCTGGSVVELKCSHCDVVKRLEQFSKRMRKNPDNALCLNCSQDVQDLEPDHKDQVQEENTMERIRGGAATTNIRSGSTALGYGANTRSIGYTNNISASTNLDGVSDWINAPIPVPDDPRARSESGSSHAVSLSSAISGTGWENFRTVDRRVSNSTSSRGGSSSRFVKQGAVKLDHVTKAQVTLARTQQRELEQSEQAALKDSDDDDDSDDSGPAY